MKSVYWCPTNGRQLAFQFDSGLIVALAPAKWAEPQAKWAEFAAANPRIDLGAVRGVPAMILEPSAEGASGAVTWQERGMEIVVYGNGSAPAEQLVQVAESLREI